MCASPDPERSRLATRPGFPFLPPLLLLLAALLPAPVRGEDFTIRSFRADLEVRRDSSLRVTETIEAVFSRPRHGIYRDIPFRYTDDLGREATMPLSVLSVTDGEGNARKYRVSRTGGSIRVRIGDPDRFVDGRQVYEITYNVENGILFFPDHDELYWNVTGTEWPVEIGSAVATVRVDSGGRPLAGRTRCYTGARGAREEACTISDFPEGATYRATRRFRPGEGMTVVLGWEKGIVLPPSRWKRLLFALEPSRNWAFLAPVATFSFMLLLWFRKGRDPDPGDPLVVSYEPPEEGGRPLLPAEAGALLDERLDPRDITATVIDLAVKGHLSIEERKTEGLFFDRTDYLLRKKQQAGELPPFERMLLERLFAGHGDAVGLSDLANSFYRNLEELKEAVFRGLVGMRYFSADPLRVRKRYVGAGIALTVGGVALAFLLGRLAADDSPRVVIPFVLCGAVVVLFASRMPAKTLKGVKALGRVRGFEEFLRRAEKDRLERMNDPRLFERYLPYAIALDVSDRWAKAFEGIYQERPGWYLTGDATGAFRPSSFHRSLGSALSSMSGALHSAPRSSGSGFSGGGGSGGGGGGGGGGSW